MTSAVDKDGLPSGPSAPATVATGGGRGKHRRKAATGGGKKLNGIFGSYCSSERENKWSTEPAVEKSRLRSEAETRSMASWG